MRILGIVCDLAVVAGCGSIAYGAWLVYAPAGFLAGGFLAVVLGVLAGGRLNEVRR